MQALLGALVVALLVGVVLLLLEYRTPWFARADSAIKLQHVAGVLLRRLLSLPRALQRRAVALGLWGRHSRTKKGVARKVSEMPSVPSQLIAQFRAPWDSFVTHVFWDLQPEVTDEVRAAFDSLNEKRKAVGKKEFYGGLCFKPIAPPTVERGRIVLYLIPLSYMFVALINDEVAGSDDRQFAQNQLQDFARRLPPDLQAAAPLYSIESSSVIGLMVCVVTSDHKVHIRKRSSDVLTARDKWDIAFGGHPKIEDRVNSGLSFTKTARRELRAEVGIVGADYRKILFTGLHVNQSTKGIDVLAYWPIDENEAGYRSILHAAEPDDFFRGIKRNLEDQIPTETENALLRFDGTYIKVALEARGIQLWDFAPESLACLERALVAAGRRPLGLAWGQTPDWVR